MEQPSNNKGFAGFSLVLEEKVRLGIIGQFAKVAPTNPDEAPLTKSVPLIKDSLDTILTKPYYVYEIPKGKRRLLLICNTGGFFISANFKEMRHAPIYCPRRPDRVRNRELPVHHWTVLDGYVVEKSVENGKLVTFVVVDILLKNNSPEIRSKPLLNRLKEIQNDIIAPSHQIKRPQGTEPDAFRLQVGSLFPVSGKLKDTISNIRQEAAASNGNITTRLMFVAESSKYVIGINESLFEWKYNNRVTAAFRIKVEWRARTRGYKLMILENGALVFHDWLTLPSDLYEAFNEDNRLNSRVVVECVFDEQHLTFIPSNEKTWENGNPNYNSTDKGIGWRQGGWKFVRFLDGVTNPVDITQMRRLEVAIKEGIRLEEFEYVISPEALKLRKQQQHDARHQRNTVGLGVCYDFQNKGSCKRESADNLCPFSHCACNNVCACTPENNTYGQRAPKSRDNTETEDVAMPDALKVEPFKSPTITGFEKEADRSSSRYIMSNPLKSFDKASIEERRKALASEAVRRSWQSAIGPKSNKRQKKDTGYVIKPSGDASISFHRLFN